MPSKKRYLSLDFLKGFAICILIVAHHLAWILVADNLTGLRYEGAYDVFQKVVFFVSYAGLPFWGFFFPMLAGASAYFLIKSEHFTLRKLWLRSGALLALGFFMNLLTWGIDNVLDWDVLPFVALSVLVSYPFIKKARHFYGLIPVFLLGAFSLFFSDVFPFPAYQNHYWYVIIFGDKTGYHYWPFFPWYALFAAGVFMGWGLSLNSDRILKGTGAAGIIFLIISYWQKGIIPVVDLESGLWGATVFKPSPFYILAVLGFGFFIISSTEALISRNKMVKEALTKSVFIDYGQSVLWVYIFSTVFGYKTTLIMNVFCENIYQALFVLPLFVFINLLLSYQIAKTMGAKRKVAC